MKPSRNELERASDDIASLQNAELPAEVCDDIAQIRGQALRDARCAVEKRQSGYCWFSGVAIPAALVITLSVILWPEPQTLPLLPGEFDEEGLSNDDLAIVEELEFAHWLAEQELGR